MIALRFGSLARNADSRAGLDARPISTHGVQKRIVRERLGVEADQMPSGHLVALSRPDELVSRLLKYVSA